MKSITLRTTALLFVFSCLTTVGFANASNSSEWTMVPVEKSPVGISIFRRGDTESGNSILGYLFTKNACQSDFECNAFLYPLLSHVGKQTGFEKEELIVEETFNTLYSDTTNRFVEWVRLGKLDCYFVFTHDYESENEAYGRVSAFCIGKNGKQYQAIVTAHGGFNLPKQDFVNTIAYLRKETKTRPYRAAAKSLALFSKDWNSARSFLLQYKNTK